jgi:hypothetical protein
VPPGQHRLRAQLAANTLWSRPMIRQGQADAARSALYEHLEREVDPYGLRPPDERDRMARSAAQALLTPLNSAKARKCRCWAV